MTNNSENRTSNWCAYVELLLLLVMYENLPKATTSQCKHQCMHNMQPCYAKFPHSLA